ncbi:MAG: 50S ribosomal protein L35 [Pseudomonadota bacterium]|nr:50S ribosomal protein L35 [Pseudomonadota bacterium]
MPKLKSNRSAAKRFKPTVTGRFKHRQSFKNHILTKKSSKRKRQLRGLLMIHAADQKAVRQMLPYSRTR